MPLGVMDDHSLAIRGGSNVKLEAVAAMHEGFVEGGKRIFRSGSVRTSAAMT